MFPPELWIRIAQFLSSNELRKLMGLNHTLYQLAMDIHYRNVCLSPSDGKRFARELNRLSELFIASRIRQVTLQLCKIGRVIPPPFSPTLPVFRSKFTNFWESLARVTQSNPYMPFRLPASRRAEFLYFLEGLQQVQELELRFTAGSCQDPFDGIWPAVRSWHISNLTINMSPCALQSLLLNAPTLNNLEVLTLSLIFSGCGPFWTGRSFMAESEIWKAVVVPFINAHCSSLLSLSITTFGHAERLGDLFGLLAVFPFLRSLTLNLPLDAYHLFPPRNISSFLQEQRAIESLSLHYSRCTSYDLHTPGQYGSFASFSGVVLPGLKHLHLSLNHSDYFTSNKMIEIGQMCPNVSSLALIHCYLGFDEVAIVLDPFLGHRLEQLSLNVQYLSPALIVQLATLCPHLHTLAIHVWAEMLNFDFSGWLRDFSKSHQDHSALRDWQLSDLSITNLTKGIERRYNWDCMLAISEAVPSITSFVGQGRVGTFNDLSPQETTECYLVL